MFTEPLILNSPYTLNTHTHTTQTHRPQCIAFTVRWGSAEVFIERWLDGSYMLALYTLGNITRTVSHCALKILQAVG